mgnify:FL=1
MGSIPVGLEDFVELVVKQDPSSGRKLPRSRNEIWNTLAYCALIDANRSEAEARYLYQLIESRGLLKFDEVLKLRTKWADRVRRMLNNEMRKLSRGRKLSLLSTFVENRVDEMNQCLLSAAQYFLNQKVSRSFLKARTSSCQSTADLVGEIAYPKSEKHIYRIGLTKTILWLQDFGLALNLCPSSRQVISFVNDDLGFKVKPSLYGEDQELVEIWADLFMCIGKVRKVAEQLTDRLSKPITTRDVGVAIWYYKSCQSLLARFRAGLKHRLTPAALITFLDQKRWDLDELGERLCSIEEIDRLASELREFASSLPS